MFLFLSSRVLTFARISRNVPSPCPPNVDRMSATRTNVDDALPARLELQSEPGRAGHSSH